MVTVVIAVSLVLLATEATAAPPALAPGFDRITLAHGAQVLDGKPEALAIPRVDGIAPCRNRGVGVGVAPAVTFEVRTRVRAMLTLGDPASHAALLPALVKGPGGAMWCLGPRAHGLLVRAWEPGTYSVHFVSDTDGFGTTVEAGQWPIALHELTPRRVVYTPGVGPNPLALGDLRQEELGEDIGNLRGLCGNAFHTTSAPAAVVDLAAAMPKLRVTAVSGPPVVVVTSADGRRWCSGAQSGGRTFVDLVDVPAGPLEIRATDAHGRDASPPDPRAVARFGVALEDPSRPHEGDTALPAPLAIDGPMAAAHVVNLPASAPADGAPVSSCADLARDARADLVLDLSRPIQDLRFRIAAASNTCVVVSGPYGPDGRADDTRFVRQLALVDRHGTLAVRSLDRGRWRVVAAPPSGPRTAPITLVVSTRDTPPTPLIRTAEPPATLPIAERDARRFYAHLPADHDGALVWRELSPEQRASLVADAPMALFVYPSFDLDEASARLLEGGDALAEAGVAIVYPRRDEPLLATSQGDSIDVLTADGLRFRVARRHMTAEPAGAVQVPSVIRSLVIGWDDARRWAGPDERAEVEALVKAQARADECFADYWEDHGGSGASHAIYVLTRVDGRSVGVRDQGDQVERAALRACGVPALDARQAKVLGKVDQRLRERAKAALARLAARFAAPR